MKSKRELTSDPGANGFQSNPSLFRSRWAVAVPVARLELVPGSRLKLHLTQTQTVNDKPALVRRARLSVSDDASWHQLVDDPNFRNKLAQLIRLARQLAKIPSVELPLMGEEPAHGIVTKRTLKGEEVFTLGYPVESSAYDKNRNNGLVRGSFALSPNVGWCGEVVELRRRLSARLL